MLDALRAKWQTFEKMEPCKHATCLELAGVLLAHQSVRVLVYTDYRKLVKTLVEMGIARWNKE